MIKQIGKYRIEGELGRGGFGRVYRAFDPDADRYVAIKVIATENNSELLGRFQTEGITTGRLDHKNIVIVYEFGRHAGMPYLVMQLLEGETLEVVIAQRRPFSLLEKVEILYQIAEGLQFAHSKGIIHRDIKPANVMVQPDHCAKLMDFGIARVLSRTSTRYTQQGDVLGTLPYMAPEHFQDHDSDPLTDIWAYGVVCYEFLTGENPFRAKEPVAVMARITTVEPAPLRPLLTGCPEALELLIQRILSKNREIRSSSFDEILLDAQPIMQQLRHDRADEIVDQIASAFDSQEFDRAETLAKQALRLDPYHLQARKWRDELNVRAQRERLNTHAREAISNAREHMKKRRFAEAVGCLESAFRLDRSNSGLASLLEETKEKVENVRQAGQLLSDARADVQKNDPEAAAIEISRALELDPDNQEALAFQVEVEGRIRKRRLAEAMSRAASLSRSGNHAGALAILEEVRGGQPEEPTELSELRARIGAALAETENRRRQEEFNRKLYLARSELDSGRLDIALSAAESLVEQFGGERLAADFLLEVKEHVAAQRRRTAIAQVTQSARAALKEKQFFAARRTLEKGLDLFPADSGIQHLLELTNALASASDKAQAVSRTVQESAEWIARGELERAAAILESAISKYGEESALVEAKRNVEFEQEQRQYGIRLSAILSEARRLIETQELNAAISLLQESLNEFSGEPELSHVLNAAKQERSRLRSSLVRNIHQAIESAEWNKAETDIQTARETFGLDHEIEDLSHALVMKRSQQAEEAARLKALREADERARLQREEAIARVREEAKPRLIALDFQGAVRLFDQLLKRYPDAQEIVESREFACAQIEQQRQEAEAVAAAALARETEEKNRVLERKKAIVEKAGDIRKLLELDEWAGAKNAAASAREQFPSEACFKQLEEEANQRQRLNAQNRLAAEIREHLERDEFEAAEQCLASGERSWGADPVWRPVTADLSCRIVYSRALRMAELCRTKGELSQAEEYLRTEIAKGAPDGRAALLLESITSELASRRREQIIGDALREAARLVALGRFSRALALLDPVLIKFPDDERIRQAAQSANAALKAERERETRERDIQAAGERTNELEKAGRYRDALREIENSLRTYPGQADADVKAENLREIINQKEQAARISTFVAGIERAIENADWNTAQATLRDAIASFPERPEWSNLRRRMHERRRQRELEDLHRDVRGCLLRHEWQEALRLLDATRTSLSQEPLWQSLSSQAERFKAYETGLHAAQRFWKEGDEVQAEQTLSQIALNDAPDHRAATLLSTIHADRVEQERKQKYKADRAIADQRAADGDFEGAIAILEAIRQECPQDREVSKAIRSLSRQVGIKSRGTPKNDRGRLADTLLFNPKAPSAMVKKNETQSRNGSPHHEPEPHSPSEPRQHSVNLVGRLRRNNQPAWLLGLAAALVLLVFIPIITHSTSHTASKSSAQPTPSPAPGRADRKAGTPPVADPPSHQREDSNSHEPVAEEVRQAQERQRKEAVARALSKTKQDQEQKRERAKKDQQEDARQKKQAKLDQQVKQDQQAKEEAVEKARQDRDAATKEQQKKSQVEQEKKSTEKQKDEAPGRDKPPSPKAIKPRSYGGDRSGEIFVKFNAKDEVTSNRLPGIPVKITCNRNMSIVTPPSENNNDWHDVTVRRTDPNVTDGVLCWEQIK